MPHTSETVGERSREVLTACLHERPVVGRRDRPGVSTVSKTPLMVSARSNSRVSHFLCQGNMEITFLLLLLIVSLTSASPLGQTQSIEAGTDLSGGAVQTLNLEGSEVRQRQHAPKLKIISFNADDKQFELLALKHSDSLNAKLRPRRASLRGCQLGTCQLHNLANILYQISKTNGKKESKKASDPQGYGR
ncbi:hypothetical protein CRENBAI_018212 [Crenichthys baileyi]|uniref:ProAM N-terminal 20 peptide n=1 Tax=Crenichthys baileyi TaxID=28760 RepID=A0AAV9SHM2_9TELE